MLLRIRRKLGNLLFELYWWMLHLPVCRHMKERRVIKCFSHQLTPAQDLYLRREGVVGEPIPMGAMWDEGVEGREWARIQTPGGIWDLDQKEYIPRTGEVRIWNWTGDLDDGTLTVVSATMGLRENGSVCFPGYHAKLYRGHLVQLLF